MPTTKSLCLGYTVELKNRNYKHHETYNREAIRGLTAHIVRCDRCKVLGESTARQGEKLEEDVRRSSNRSRSNVDAAANHPSGRTFTEAERKADSEGEALPSTRQPSNYDNVYRLPTREAGPASST